MSTTETGNDVVICEPMDPAAVDSLRRRFAVHYDPTLVDRPDALRAQLAGTRALIVRNRTRVDEALLGHAPRLIAVGRLGVGLDNIDLAACKKRGIAVFPASGANTRAVAEYVIAATLIALRGAFDASADVGAGRWPRAALSDGNEAFGKTLGLVGFGDIGQCVARYAVALGLRVLASDPAHAADAPVWHETGATPAALPTLLATADIVSLHLPLNDATRGLFDAPRLAGMKPGAILINTARGGIVDESALAHALTVGQLRAAVVDVFADEPLPARSPLSGLPNAKLTPHIAGLTVESNARIGALVAERIVTALDDADTGKTREG